MVSSDPSFASSPFRPARVKIFVEITAPPPPTNSGTKGEIAKKENKKKKSRHQFFFTAPSLSPNTFFISSSSSSSASQSPESKQSKAKQCKATKLLSFSFSWIDPTILRLYPIRSLQSGRAIFFFSSQLQLSGS